MDPHRFDTVTRELTRRGALASLAGGTLALVGLTATTAKHKKKHHHKTPSPVSPPSSPPSPPPPPAPCVASQCPDPGACRIRACANNACAPTNVADTTSCGSGGQVCRAGAWLSCRAAGLRGRVCDGAIVRG